MAVYVKAAREKVFVNVAATNTACTALHEYRLMVGYCHDCSSSEQTFSFLACT